MTETSAPPARPPEYRVLRGLLGLALIVPAALACGLTLLAPSLTMVNMSFQRVQLLRSDSQPVGLANYLQLGRILGAGGAIPMTLLVTGARLAAILVIPALLALGISRSLPALRIGARLLLTVPAALFAPYLALIAWIMGAHPAPSPDSIRASLLLAEGVMALALGCAVLTPVYLTALSAPPAGPSAPSIPWRPLVVVWLVSLLAVLALTPQGLATSFVTQGGPVRSTETLMLLIYRQAFTSFQFGLASALSTLLLAGVMLLGLIAGGLVIWSGLGLQTGGSVLPAADPAARSRLLIVGLLMLAITLACAGMAWLPYLVRSAQPTIPSTVDLGQLLARTDRVGTLALTILPPLVGVFVIQLPLSYLAALGIGAARPLGRHSELLLLPFSPWLFVTVGPLVISLFVAARMAGSLGTPVALLPRFAISVPILFILTLFFKGQEARRRVAGGSILRFLILPSLPLALLLGFAAALVEAQGLIWPLVVSTSPSLASLPVMVTRVMGQFSGSPSLVIGLILAFEAPIFAVWLAIFGIFQVFYLPRLALARAEFTAPTDSPPAETAPSVEPLPGVPPPPDAPADDSKPG